MGLNPLICGIIIAALVGIVLLGGIQRLAWFASFIVPLKACLYLGTALIILGLNIEKVFPALKFMFNAAFDPQSAFGGMVGFSIVKAISCGFDRGIFATDAGTGIVPILQSSARTTNPVIDGVVTLVAPFLVMVVCTITGLVLLVTGVWQESGLQSTNMVTHAFQLGLGNSVGAYIVIIALLMFAYTTVLAWAYCAEKAVGFLYGTKYADRFKYLYVALIPIGTFMHVDFIWRLSDISISLMLMVNLIGVMRLSKEVIGESQKFFLEKVEVQAAQ